MCKVPPGDRKNDINIVVWKNKETEFIVIVLEG